LRQALLIAANLAAALAGVHGAGLIHKDLKPANVILAPDGSVRLTGFGLATRLPRERQAPAPPEVIAGTLAYMAPEQTGRMNRSLDARSDLYALGMILYEVLTGTLPFAAADALEWVHCHIARPPPPPSIRGANVPALVDAIVLKLLAKAPEERYQTAAGLEHDLRLCLAQWQAHGRLDPFPLGAHDIPDRLLIPEILYGRQAEVATLLTIFERVVISGATELVLVSGYSGIGKSALVSELHRELGPRVLYAAGKFDQYKRDIPYASLAQAFQSLIQELLGKSDAELELWRGMLLQALGANAQLIVALIPDLALVIGEPAPAPDIPPQDQQSRFQLVFRRFIEVFARPEHPLVLLLDDLQWLDRASLELLERLAGEPELGHLLLIGAYRDNEVGPTHPLAGVLDRLRGSTRLREIVLKALSPAAVEQLVADALHSVPARVRTLAGLVFAKTAGNPFFVIQFLTTLVDEGLLGFDHARRTWRWEVERIEAKAITDNVVELMASRFTHFELATLAVLQQLACLGTSAPAATLGLLTGLNQEEIHSALWEIVRTGLVLRQGEIYAFAHDRVQEAAYALLPEAEQAEAHLRIGRMLAAETAPEQLAESIFEIVSQLNRGAGLIDTLAERERLAELNLRAGKRAKSSTAYEAALGYFRAGRGLLAEDSWERQHGLTFELELHWAECEFLTGGLPAAEERLIKLSSRATSTTMRAAVVRLINTVYYLSNQHEMAVSTGIEYMRVLGANWQHHPSLSDIEQEYRIIQERINGWSSETIIGLPLMTDPDCRDTITVLHSFHNSAFHYDRNLADLVAGRMANLSFQHGNCDVSPVVYSYVAQNLGYRFRDYEGAFRLGTAAFDMVERLGFDASKARVYTLYATVVVSWTRRLSESISLNRLAFDASREVGDIICATWARVMEVSAMIACGVPLSDVQHEIESGLKIEPRVQGHYRMLMWQLKFVLALRGPTPSFGSFNDEEFDRVNFEQPIDPDLSACRYWIRKLQAHFLAGDYALAQQAMVKAQVMLVSIPLFIDNIDYHFYAALLIAARCNGEKCDPSGEQLASINAHYEEIHYLAQHRRENFEDRVALVAAEIARVEGRVLDAQLSYEQAIRSAQSQGFVHNEAVAYELAARFYCSLGLESIAGFHLQNARSCFQRWGADAKVRQLEQTYPQLRQEPVSASADSTIRLPVDHLDLSTIVKVSQAISGEIDVRRLIHILMTIALEHSGGDRAVLILSHDDSLGIEAEATMTGFSIEVQLRQAPLTPIDLPGSVLRYVLRTRDRVLVHDVAEPNPYSDDEYLCSQPCRSLTCLPLVKQNVLSGVIYIESQSTSHVFTPARLAVLELLASQAAVSLENTRLYRDLAEREAKIRRLVDADIIGIVIWDLDGRVIDANDAFLRMIQYERQDLNDGLRWFDITPPEWQEAHVLEEAEELRTTGKMQVREKEYFRKDGGRVPVLIGAAAFDGQPNQGVAYILDLTERKLAERAVRESEQRYHQVHAELAHANRVATMGQLTGSIAHEVSQPIAATIISAHAGLRWLGQRPPALEEVRQLFDQIIKDGTRAGEVVSRIRELIKKVSPRQERLEINGPIREVIELTRNETVKKLVSVETNLAEGLPLVYGDRVQLQQVVLNLIINAVEAMSDVGDGVRELVISTRKSESRGVLVSVRDSGLGLLPEVRDRIFEAFYTTKPAGLGMGLSICRSIVEMHGGQLWAIANEPRGAIFQFTLPPQNGMVSAEHSSKLPR
jgi:PAS domain S-box-containing protein